MSRCASQHERRAWGCCKAEQCEVLINSTVSEPNRYLSLAQEERFRQLHRDALRFPAGQFAFVGNQVPVAAEGAQAGEVGGQVLFRAIL